MVYKRFEDTVNGHEIVVQQVRGPDSRAGASEPSAWIDGNASYVTRILKESDTEVTFRFVKAMAVSMARCDKMYCKKCGNFYDYTEANTFGFCDHKCTDCATKDATCQEGGKHSWKCTNPRQKNNARRPTKYKCEMCGKKKQTVPTG